MGCRFVLVVEEWFQSPKLVRREMWSDADMTGRVARQIVAIVASIQDCRSESVVDQEGLRRIFEVTVKWPRSEGCALEQDWIETKQGGRPRPSRPIISSEARRDSQ